MKQEEIEDLFLSRYHDMKYILSLSIERAVALINKATYENKRDQVYAWWLARLPMYTQETYETYDEFYEKVYPPIVLMDMRSKDDIMNELLKEGG